MFPLYEHGSKCELAVLHDTSLQVREHHFTKTNVEISLFGSLPALASFISHPVFCGCILDRLGRKHTAMLATLFFVIAWSLKAVTNKVELIITAVFIAGWGHSIFLIAAIYNSEIAQSSIRGTMTSGSNLACCFGYVTSYFLGGALEYHGIVYVCLLLSVIGVLMIAVLKDSPVTLMVKGKEKAAAESVAFYRWTSSSSKEVMTELNNIRRSINKDSDGAQSLTQTEKVTPKMSCWQIFKSSPPTRRQFYLVLVLKTSYICQGLPIVQVYAKPMFAATVGDSMSPDLCSVVFGLVLLAAGFVAAYLTDKVGRRPLQVYSSIMAGICCAVLGTQILTEWFPKWTVPLFVCVFAMSHTVGSGTVPFVVGAEIFLPEVKSILLTVTAEWVLIFHFSFLFLFNILVQSIGLSSIFYFFSIICFAASTYFYYFLPETKGLPAYAIQALFVKETDRPLFYIQ